ncbi:MAG: response regulator transcription factor [Planctomycetes bacterium]|nr:response regulator transcription factor [Planctomycetota bacterium]
MRLLLIEDDSLLGKSIQRGLTDAGHACDWVTRGDEALRRAKDEWYDVMVLDLMLPDLSGLDVVRRLRAEGGEQAVLILTALGSLDDRVAGLRAGADDYLVKPFAFAELSARVDALGRRSGKGSRTELREGPLVLDLRTRRVTRDGRDIELTPTEFNLLEYLVRNADQTVTRRMLCEHLWDADWEGVTNVIEVHINRLRSKIERGFDDRLIHTVRGIGYALRAR